MAGRWWRISADPTRPPLVPSPRATAIGLLALLAMLGGGLAFWALPVPPALGEPGVFVEAPATASDLRAGKVTNSPSLSNDPRFPDFVALAHRVDRPDLGCDLEVSGDGGEGWVGIGALSRLPDGVDRCHSPMTAFDGRGALYFAFTGLAGGEHKSAGVFITRSTDSARTFTIPSRVTGPLAYGARMAVDQVTGRVHVVWLQARSEPTITGFVSPDNSVMATHSDDGGRTFSKPVVVTVASEGHRWAAPVIGLRPGGRVDVAFFDLQDDSRDYEGSVGGVWEGRWRLLLARSSDGGTRFEAVSTADASVVPPFRVPSIFTMAPPALAVGKTKTCLAWTDARYGDPDVLLRCRHHNSEWGGVHRVNQDPASTGIWQYLPALGMAKNGRLDIVFYDRRSDPGNGQAEVGYSYAYDERLISSNRAISRARFDSTVGIKRGHNALAPVDFGSQLAVLSLPSSAVAAWADSRNHGEQGIVQDIYTAQASLLLTNTRPGWGVPVGVFVVVASGGGIWVMHRRTAEGVP